MHKRIILKTVSLILALLTCFGTVSATAGAAEVNGAQAIVDTALSQVGTYEGSGGYTKYGDYFGSPYIAWCCAFVSWCARTTGISESVIPTNLSCTAMRDYFQSLNLYYRSDAYGGYYKPKQGDLIFFTSTSPSNRSQSNITHIGIVVDATSSYVTCVEGNCPDRVRKIDRQYTSYIAGYATPKYTGVSTGNAEPEIKYETGVYITDEVMNFRSTPGGNIICTIPVNTTLTISEVQGAWGKTTYNGNTGWMSLTYSTYQSGTIDKPGTQTPIQDPSAITPQNTNKYKVYETTRLRSAPNTSSAIIGSVPAGTLVEVTEKSSNWGKLTYNGVTGWMCLDWSSPYNREVDWLIMDISQWQRPSDINWTKLKNAGVKGVIIRIGGRGSDGAKSVYADDSFLQHYKNAKAAGMYVGVYFFSYALTKAGAIEEANFTVNTLKKHNCQLDLPVYIDMEDYGSDKSHLYAGKTTCSMVLDEFCKVVENAGYYAGIYVSRSFAETHVNPSVFNNRSVWIAEWDTSYCTYNGHVDVWQYTETGVISGAPGKVDLNRMYTNYPQRFKNQSTTTPSPSTPVVPAPTELKGDIDDNKLITAADSRLALRYSVGLEKFTEKQKTAADVDNNGSITAADARIILKASLN